MIYVVTFSLSFFIFYFKIIIKNFLNLKIKKKTIW